LVDRIASHFSTGNWVERRDILNAGIIDEHVQPAVIGKRGCDHLGDRFGLCHIRGRIAHVHAETSRDLVLDPGDLGRSAEAVQHHRGAGLGERTGDAQAMPLVEPVTTETLPISGREAEVPCDFNWMFMTDLFAW